MEARSAVVVGAGIVGLCCAIELRRRGWAVTLVDRGDPGQACSAGNAGILAAQAVVPLALPGLWRQLPALLLARDAPLVLRWRSLPHTARWLLQLARAGRLEQVQRSAVAMKALYGSTVERHQALAHEAGASALVHARPGLYVHRDAAALDVDGALAWQLRRRHGAQIELLDDAALHDAEPALAPAYTRGVRMRPMGFTTQPLRLAQAYAALFVRMGGRLQRLQVKALEPRDDAVRVHGDGQVLAAARVVVAAGAWSDGLLRPLGARLPLVAERGYHLQYPAGDFTLRHVVSEVGAHVAVTSMETGLRIAGTEEIGLADEPPDWRRAQRLDAIARRLFPQARLGAGQPWMGPRPGTPDSLPLIGALPALPRVIVATGHGHLGLTGAPHTGAIVAALADGDDAGIDLAPFAPLRFDARIAASTTTGTPT